MGTSVGTLVFNAHGWRPAAALSLGWQSLCVCFLLMRGPHCSRYTWFGYEGGFSRRKRKTEHIPEKPVSGNENTIERSDTAEVVDEKGVEGKVEDTVDRQGSRSSTEKSSADLKVEQG